MNKIIILTVLFVSSIGFAANEEVTKINAASHMKFSAGGNIGARSFTGTQSDIYTDGSFFGLSFSYLVNSHTALQLSYNSGNNEFNYPYPSDIGATNISGTTTLTSLSFHGKYFLKSKKLSSKFNPYALIGFSQFSRKSSIAGQPLVSGRDSALGFDIGLGAEVLFNKKKNFITFELVYNSVDFPNENQEIILVDNLGNTVNSGIIPSGNPLALQVGFGIYF